MSTRHTVHLLDGAPQGSEGVMTSYRSMLARDLTTWAVSTKESLYRMKRELWAGALRSERLSRPWRRSSSPWPATMFSRRSAHAAP